MMPLFSLRLVLAAAIAPAGLFLVRSDPAEPPPPVPIIIEVGAAEVDAAVEASAATVSGALRALAIETDDALLIPPPDTPLTPGLHIAIIPQRHVTLRDGSAEPRAITTFAHDVAGALREAEILLGPLDRVAPPLTSPLRNGTTIVVTRVAEEERTEIVAIPFRSTTADDPTLPWGQERVIEEGRVGSAQERVRLRYENGRVVARTVLARTVIEQPRPEQRARGTKITVGRTQEGLASWYRYRGCPCAASTSFPRGTHLRVTNLTSGAAVIVRVNDYGPVLPGRVVDLDAVAFRQLTPLGKGVISVRVEEIL